MIKLLAALLALFIGSAQAADNTAVTAGAGTTMATKDIGGGVQAPKVYLVDGTGNPCTTTAGGTASCVIVIEGVSGGVPVMVNVQNGVTQAGTWTVQPGNTANTTPWLATINQGGNSAIVAAGASPYGAALAVAGGITPAAATSLAPLSSPILAAVATQGSTSYIQGQLNIPVMTTPGRLAVDNSNVTVSSTVVSGTTGVANTFQSVFAATASRYGCTIQNLGSGTLFVYVTSIAGATTPKSFSLASLGTFDCAHGTIVLSDQISVAAATSTAFMGLSQ